MTAGSDTSRRLLGSTDHVAKSMADNDIMVGNFRLISYHSNSAHPESRLSLKEKLESGIWLRVWQV
jgi:hypothetical protein